MTIAGEAIVQEGAGAAGSVPPSLRRVIEAAARIAGSRIVFALTALCGAAIFWLAPRPPMTDLPQHAAQIALWKDLILGTSPWNDLFRINLLTPYLSGYAVTLGLAFIVPVMVAIKIVLSAAYLAFVVSCVQLSRDLGGDRRLDWLAIPAFFGFAYDWGFYNYLVAAPVALQFLRIGLAHARQPSWKTDAGLVALGIVLLFSHGLMMLFACAVGGALLLGAWAPHFRTLPRETIVGLLRGGMPYVVLALSCIAYFVASRNLEAPAAISAVDWWEGPLVRAPLVLAFVQGSSSATALPLTLVLLAAPLLLGLRGSWLGAIPMMVLALVLFAAPHSALSTDYLFERFALFILPFAMLAYGGGRQDDGLLRQRVGYALLMIAAVISIAYQGSRAIAFAAENRDFESVLAAAEPGKRAAVIVTDKESPGADNMALAKYQPSWYQVDKGGLVEFNFAYFHSQVVRYRSGMVPADGFAFTDRSPKFDWALPQTRLYDYYFVRGEGGALPKSLIERPACDLIRVTRSGSWWLLARGGCKA